MKGVEEKKNKKDGKEVSFRELFRFADGLDMLLIVIGTIGAIANGVTQPLMTVVFGQLINAFGKTTDRDQITHEVSKVCLDYVYLAIGAGIASLLQVTCWMVSGERQAARIRGLYLKTILRQDIAFFDTETTTGEVIGRMSGDTILIQDAIGEKVGKFIQQISTVIGGFVIAFVRGWLLALVLTSTLPALVIVGIYLSLATVKMMSRGQIAYAEAGTVVEQTIGAIRTVVAFTGEKKAIEKYNRHIRNAYKAIKHNGIASGSGFGMLLLIIFSTYGLAIWYGSKLIIKGDYDGGKVINVIMSILTGGIALGQVAPLLNAFSAGKAAAYKMLETIKRSPKIDTYDTSGVVLNEIKGDIELKDVSFAYPARPDVQIFSGFSLKIPSGVTAALVGQSGSGKSTVISLLERFYDPDGGEILIDGVNLKTLQLKWIRNQMGLVSQEPILFGTSIKENIAYGKENATDKEIRTAIQLANAAKFIDKLPEGLDTMVGEHGIQMSGGQKQRIAIARAILKNPKILLLDEATSALDAESERVVQNALERVMTNRTTVVVAHRLTTIRNADIIAVLHAGKLVEQGTHEELIRDSEGAYTQLIQMQGGNNHEAAHQDRTNNADDDSEDDMISLDLNGSINRSSKISRELSSTNRRSSSFYVEEKLDGNNNKIIEKESNVIEKRKNVSILRLFSLNKPEFPVLALGSVAACVQGVIFPFLGLLLSKAIKIFFEPPTQLKKDSVFWALMCVALGCVTVVAIPVKSLFFGIAGGKLVERIRALTFEKIVHQEISWFDDPANSSGAVGARLSTDAATVRGLVGDTLALQVQNLATIVAGLVIAFTANVPMAAIILAVLPLVGLQGILQTKLYRGFSADAKVMYEEASQVANDAVGSIRTVASFCAEQKVMDMYQKKCEGPMKAGVRLGVVSGVGFGIGSCAIFLVNSFCFYIASILEKHGIVTFAEIFRAFFALQMAAIGVTQANGFMGSDLNKARDSAASIFDILDSKPKIDSSKDGQGTTIDSVKGDIEFRHVRFNYPSRPDIPVFRDLCLTIPSGKTVALVGESGSGKSTVISLIERFYDPDAGHIYLDGVEIRQLKLHWLRQQMGLVSQEPILFNETIRENIAYGRTGSTPTEEEIITAAKSANAHNFVSSLPQGYDTNVGERGVQLSGGQKQRIAIARAIIKNPKILLLDEATSALDTESERVVQDALDSVMMNRTTVVVAHRLATVRGADAIAVVQNGVIVEKGKHNGLMSIPDGVYASLVALQVSST